MIKTMFIIYTTLLILCCPMIVSAQINTENLRNINSENGIYHKISLSSDYESGNSNNLQISTGLRTDYYSNSLSFFLESYAKYKEARNKMITNKAFVHARCEIKLSVIINPEFFIQKSFNKAIKVSDRNLAGAGARINIRNFFLPKDTAQSLMIYLGVGGMYENEHILAENQVENLIRSTNYLNIKWGLDNRVSLVSTTYYQFNIIRPIDYRILSDISASFIVTEYFAFSISIHFRHDNEPPNGIIANDFEIVNGLVFNF
jgi:putative salt-induced outer membrane protein YdiY